MTGGCERCDANCDNNCQQEWCASDQFCTHRWDSSNLGNPGLCQCQREANHFGPHRCCCGATIRYVTDWKDDDE